jgi:hypothetical protein
MLNVLDITSKIRIVAMFINIKNIPYVIYIYDLFLSRFKSSEPKTKENFRTASMKLFYILQKLRILTRSITTNYFRTLM